MTHRKLYQWAAAGVAVALVLVGCLFLMKQEKPWPQFDPNLTGPAPAVQIEVERDFGYRTGDVIPITIFVKQFPGTSVDVEGLALDGDFEIRGDVKVDSRGTEDGGKVTRVKMNVQSFAFKPKISARVSMTWAQDGSKDWQEIPPAVIALHTSATWDGRDQLQEGRPAYVQGIHLLVTIAWLVGGILACILATLYIRRETAKLPVFVDPPRKLTRYEEAIMRFDAVWARVLEGDRSDSVFQEIDVITRNLLNVETVRLGHLDIALSNHPFKRQGLYIIKTCERRLFRGDKVSERHVMSLKVAFDVIVSRKVARKADGELETL